MNPKTEEELKASLLKLNSAKLEIAALHLVQIHEDRDFPMDTQEEYSSAMAQALSTREVFKIHNSLKPEITSNALSARLVAINILKTCLEQDGVILPSFVDSTELMDFFTNLPV